jgi:hypothetical protein
MDKAVTLVKEKLAVLRAKLDHVPILQQMEVSVVSCLVIKSRTVVLCPPTRTFYPHVDHGP